jgi:hypothetical protein
VSFNRGVLRTHLGDSQPVPLSWPLTNAAAPTSGTIQYATSNVAISGIYSQFQIDAMGNHGWGTNVNGFDATLGRTATATLGMVGLLAGPTQVAVSGTSGFNVSGGLLPGDSAAAGAGSTAGMTNAPISLTATLTPTVNGSHWYSVARFSGNYSNGSSMVSGLFLALRFDPKVTLVAANGTLTRFVGIDCSPYVLGAATSGIFQAYGVRVAPDFGSGMTTNLVATAIGVYIQPVYANTTLGIGMQIDNIVGTTNLSLAIGTSPSQHRGFLALGGSTITTVPVYGLDLQSTATNGAVLGQAANTGTPTNPASGNGFTFLWKGATNWYQVIAFNDAGTMRYRHMKLNDATTVTWTHATTLPA